MGYDSHTDTVEATYRVESDISEQIKGLCQEIHSSTLFSDHEHLLIGALSALKAARDVLGSANRDAFLGKRVNLFSAQ